MFRNGRVGTARPGRRWWAATLVLTTAGAGAPGAAVVAGVLTDHRPRSHLVISSPEDGDLIRDNAPAIAGSGPAGYQVAVSDGSTHLCTSVVAENGSWSCRPWTPMADGPHTLTPTGTDRSGKRITGSPVTFTVDSTAPTKPGVSHPGSKATVSDNTPVIRGTAEPAATVLVSEGSRTLCTATANQSQAWSCASTALADGRHVITATATDPAGNPSPAAELSFTVDRTAPPAPVITTPDAGAAVNDNTPTIAGTGAPGTTVAVTGGGKDALCQALVAADGHWSCTADSPLADGEHGLTPCATDAAGNATTGTPVPVTVDTTAPGPPSITDPADGSANRNNRPTVTGSAEPGGMVTVTDGGATTLCTAGVKASGAWACTPAVPLPEGPVTLRATVTDSAKNSTAGPPVRVTIDVTPPAAPRITEPKRGSLTNDPTPTISGTAEPGNTVTVRDLADRLLCTVTVGGAGTWSCEPTTPLPDGPATLRPAAADPAGNATTGGPVQITVDCDPPEAPAITTPADGSSTTDTTPTMAGTGEPGSKVTVTDADAGKLCHVAVPGNGRWSCTPDSPLAEGRHKVTPEAEDEAGNTVRGEPVRFTVDTDGPTRPTITKPDDGDLVSENPVTFVGRADPGTKLAVLRPDKTVLCTVAEVPSDGQWSCRSPKLPEGKVTACPVSTDDAGNSTSGDPVTFLVDSAPPPPPTITKPANGSTIDDNTPSFAGTTEPGTAVSVADQRGRVLCRTLGEADGTWACVSTVRLKDGRYKFTPTATDKAGNKRSGKPVKVRIEDCGCSPSARRRQE